MMLEQATGTRAGGMRSMMRQSFARGFADKLESRETRVLSHRQLDDAETEFRASLKLLSQGKTSLAIKRYRTAIALLETARGSAGRSLADLRQNLDHATGNPA